MSGTRHCSRVPWNMAVVARQGLIVEGHECIVGNLSSVGYVRKVRAAIEGSDDWREREDDESDCE